jgi:hypothetical protein
MGYELGGRISWLMVHDSAALQATDRRRLAGSFLIFAGVGAIGTILMAWFTHRGIGLWEDSFDYVTSALSLAGTGRFGRVDGLGQFRPLTHFPPGYPAALALLHLSGPDIYVAARWMSCALFGATVGLIGVTALLLTGSVAWGLMASALVLTSEVIVGVHLWALSEPLYLFLSLLTLILLSAYLRSPWRQGLLWGAALACSLGLLTRFVGVSLLMACGLTLVTFPYAEVRRRLADGARLALVASLPTGAFLLRNLSLSGNPADLARLAWHLPSPAEWQEAARILLNWILPDFVVESLPGAAALAVAAVIVVAGLLTFAWWVGRKRRRPASATGAWAHLMPVYLAYGAAYVFTVLVTVIFVDRMTPLDSRILSPLYPLVVVLGIGLMAEAWMLGGAVPRWVIAAACVLLFTFQSARFRGLLLVLPADSRGFASNSWQNSETIQYVRRLPPVPIYSNEIQALYFLAGRNATFIPTPLNPATGELRPDYEASLASMRERLHSEGGALVLISPSELSPDEMSELVDGLVLEATFPDGVVYRSAAGGTRHQRDQFLMVGLLGTSW